EVEGSSPFTRSNIFRKKFALNSWPPVGSGNSSLQTQTNSKISGAADSLCHNLYFMIDALHASFETYFPGLGTSRIFSICLRPQGSRVFADFTFRDSLDFHLPPTFPKGAFEFSKDFKYISR